jgi:hypothetical protein
VTDAGGVGIVVIVAFLVAAVGSVPVVLAAVLLARRVRPFSRALTYAGGGVAVLVLALAVAVATIATEAGVVVVTVAAASGVVLWVIPLLIARWVLLRRGVAPDRALRIATLGVPVALLASLVIVFGDFSRYNITFLSGSAAVLAWTALAVVVAFGPAVVGVALERLRR